MFRQFGAYACLNGQILARRAYTSAPRRSGKTYKISLQTTRVVRQRTVLVGDLDATGLIEGRGAEIDRHAGERARGDAAAPGAGGQVDGLQALGGAQDDVALVGHVLAVARERRLAAVEDGRGLEAGHGRQGPVPVGQVAREAALCPQRLFEQVDEVSVPGEEVAGV